MRLVENQYRRFGSADHYWCVWLNGRPHLFTTSELNHARSRADKNPEDCPKQCWWNRVLDFFKLYE